jgi:hypothetical protein
LIGREPPKYCIRGLDRKYRETSIRIGRINPILPVFGSCTATLVLYPIDVCKKGRWPIARIVEGYSMRAGFRGIERIENHITIRSRQAIENLQHAVAIIDHEPHRLCG